MRTILSVGKTATTSIALAAAWLFGICGNVNAHSDPWGDIHPKVSILDGKFAITFRTMLPRNSDDYSEGKPSSRMIYNADGTLFSPRHPIEKPNTRGETGPVGLYGREIQVGEDTLIFQTDRSPKPGYLLRGKDGKVTQARLPWPEDVSLTLFEDALVTADGIAITGKQNKEARDQSLFFYWFPHAETKAGKVVDIGPTACIYDFPVTSNIAYAGGRFWIAYMKSEDEKEQKLLLWSWKPGEKNGRVEVLDSPADWNSSLSLAAIGDRLCLAYHCVVPKQDESLYSAKIVTVFRKAE